MESEKSHPEALASQSNKSVAEQIVDTILRDTANGIELWHTAKGEHYISLRYGDGHVEHRLLSSKDTKDWLAGLFYNRTGKVASSSNLKDAMAVLEGYAQKGIEYVSYVRVGESDGAIYLDLGDNTWNAVKITPNGWEIVENPPVKFRRPSGMLPLPVPMGGATLDDDLRPLINAENSDDWLLIKAWLLGLLRAVGPYVILVFSGEQGTAKSYTQKLLRSIVDPNELPIRRPAKNQEDLMIAANNSWVVSFDNMSGINKEMSDDLCNVATGGGISKRKLYYEADETIIRVCRPIILNGIEDIVTRPDLLDRSILITLSRIPTERRQPEDKLIDRFNALHPMILGALLDAAVIAMAKSDGITLNDSYRMAGFVKWAAAGLGSDGDRFLEVYKAKRANAAIDALEGDNLVVQLKAFVQVHPSWIGTATTLLEILNDQAGYDKKRPPEGWPKIANQLSNQIRRLAPPLRTEGIKIEEATRDPKSNAKRWKITKS